MRRCVTENYGGRWTKEACGREGGRARTSLIESVKKGRREKQKRRMGEERRIEVGKRSGWREGREEKGEEEGEERGEEGGEERGEKEGRRTKGERRAAGVDRKRGGGKQRGETEGRGEGRGELIGV